MLPEMRCIAVFSLAYAPFEGGAEIAARKIIAQLPDFRFTVFTYRFARVWPVREEKENGEIVRLGRGSADGTWYGQRFGKFFYALRAFHAAVQEHRRTPFAAVWAIMASYGGMAALFFKLRHPDVPFLLTLQEGDAENHILRRVGIFYPFWRLIFKKADRIQVISTYLGDFARRHGAKCPIEVIPNGVDLEKFKAESLKLKVKEGSQKVIITTSRLVYKNGVDILIRAFAKVINDKRFALCDLLIIGDGPLRQDLEKLARDLGVYSKVKFFGQVPHEKVPEHLAGADIFVRASRSEGLGSSFLEAMAVGLPVIGTPVGGIPDFLRDGETGMMVVADDYRGLSEKIKELLGNRKLRRKFAENSLRLVNERYSWKTIGQAMRTFFLTLHKLVR